MGNIHDAAKAGFSLGLDDIRRIFSPRSKDYQVEIVDSRFEPGNISKLFFSINLLDNAGTKIGIMNRFFLIRADGKIAVYQDPVAVSDRNYKRLFDIVNRDIESDYMQHGISEVVVDAKKFGAYDKALQGYDFASGIEQRKVVQIFRRYVGKMSNLSYGQKRQLMYGFNKVENSILTLNHSWYFAAWNPFNEKAGEHLGKKIMLQTTWKGSKVLHSSDPGFILGKKYQEQKAKAINIK